MRKHFHYLMLAVVVPGVFACASGGTSTSTGSKPNPSLISDVEIANTPNLRDAYEVVLRLRPTWLTKAKTSGVSMSGTSAARTSGVDAGSLGGTVVVYLDNSRVGGLDALKDIPLSTVGTVQFMEPATAQALLPGLGTTPIAGAIIVHSRAH
jgi:hypothetical protein